MCGNDVCVPQEIQQSTGHIPQLAVNITKRVYIYIYMRHGNHIMIADVDDCTVPLKEVDHNFTAFGRNFIIETELIEQVG